MFDVLNLCDQRLNLIIFSFEVVCKGGGRKEEYIAEEKNQRVSRQLPLWASSLFSSSLPSTILEFVLLFFLSSDEQSTSLLFTRFFGYVTH